MRSGSLTSGELATLTPAERAAYEDGRLRAALIEQAWTWILEKPLEYLVGSQIAPLVVEAAITTWSQWAYDPDRWMV